MKPLQIFLIQPRLARDLPVLLVAVAILCAAAACGPGAEKTHAQKGATHPLREPRRMKVEVVATYPHDPDAYTQGLVWHDGVLFEGTGQYGRSSIRRYRPGDEEPEVIRQLPPELFGEGVTVVGDRLYQLTWKSGRAFVYDPVDLEPIEELKLEGEGWGLAYDGTYLIMSDGTHVLRYLDPKTLERRSRIQVKRRGSPLDQLNELELVGTSLYANVWQTDQIVEIEAETGTVVATIDASGLLTTEESREAEVLNGIAYRQETETFFITGKNWPHLFEVRFVAIPERPAS